MVGERAMDEPNLRFVGIEIDTAGAVGPVTVGGDKSGVEQDDAKQDVVGVSNELKYRVEFCVAAAMVDLSGTKDLVNAGVDAVGPVQDSTISSTTVGEDEIDIGALMELAMG
jgi:hypothetical protein